MFKNNLSKTPAIRSIILIRLMVSVVFISEGIQKFLFPAMRGPGRFEKMGFPNPPVVAVDAPRATTVAP